MAAYKGGKLSDGTPLNVAVYKAYRNAGLSHSQAMAVTSEVGRENSFNANILFGNHTDPAANSGGIPIRNLGMLSWNQGRDTQLERHLNQKGVMRGGRMAQTQANLNAQAQFSVSEMKSPRYASKLKNFWSNPNANPDAYAKELGKHYIAWAYGQDTIKAQGGGRKAFNWKANDNRRRGYLNTLGGMLGDKNNYSQGQPQQQAPDPRLSMSAPDLLATLRKGKEKRSDLQILYELSNNNGLAGREIKQLMAQGESIDNIASQLGLKVPVSQPQAVQKQSELPEFPSFEQFTKDNAEPEPFPTFEEFTANNSEAPIEQQEPPPFPSFEEFIANEQPTEQPTQAGDTWQTQKISSDSTLNEKNAKALPMEKSSWESLS